MPDAGPAPDDGLLGRLLERAHLQPPDRIGWLLAEVAEEAGAAGVTLHLVDHDQRSLVPLPGPTGAEDHLSVGGTLAGRAFVEVLPQTGTTPEGSTRLWLPVVDGVERLGVLGVTLPAEPTEAELAGWRQLASLVAEVVASRSTFADALLTVRRTRPMSLQAELLWQLLPPLTVGTERVVISGIVEPAYDVGGDAFDYALAEGGAHVAVFDGLGHGLQSGLLSTLAVTAYRHARRAGEDLVGAARAADAALATHFGPERFVTGVLCHLDTGTGRLSWVNAGHPPPLLLRGRQVVKELAADPAPPLGLAGGDFTVATEDLEPGDRVLLYTDGVVEARTPEGEFFGVERLVDVVVRESSARRPAPETLRRVAHAVLEHQHGELQDDATTVLVEWRTATVPAAAPAS